MTNKEAIRFATCLMDNSVVNDNDLELFCDMVVKALEYREPKKPITLTSYFLGTIKYPACPNCEEEVVIGESKFCCNCGQCIDWEDYDDD